MDKNDTTVHKEMMSIVIFKCESLHSIHIVTIILIVAMIFLHLLFFDDDIAQWKKICSTMKQAGGAALLVWCEPIFAGVSTEPTFTAAKIILSRLGKNEWMMTHMKCAFSYANSCRLKGECYKH